MTPNQLKRQKFAGYLFPILVGWVMIVWAFACTIWMVDNPALSNSDWVLIFILLIWLPFFPLMGFVMGIVNSFCWKNLKLGEKEAGDTMKALGLFWLFTFPATILLICSVIGFVGVLFHMTFFMIGQERGKIWIANNTIDKFLGKKNDWEREDLE